MPHHERITIEGRIGDIFFHRFVLELDSGEKLLADVGPKGVEAFPLESGSRVHLEGERKPSEIKVERIGTRADRMIATGHKPHGPGHHHEPHADPQVARRAVAKAGFQVFGEPRRKPKHFEVLARDGNRWIECHVELDGHIRKEKPIDAGDPKWSGAFDRAA